ncbi:acyl-CoA N-acyltransferase [Massariosphaeria phaeospora]|uniref:Acyl-CoA N-acyltransferase n=1 Tax=Massariosphaeria phaeospora TaxID=100035 RepID=A0A7C8M3X4_9PLEO|nr:acyl-CoA N-acyltransferase [Massariosphaeria phaeospora]
MSPRYLLAKAEPADSEAIASLFAISWASPFTRLQFGNVDPPMLAAAMAPRIAQQMSKPNVQFIVARKWQTREVVAVAQWRLPLESGNTQVDETAAEQEERQRFEDETYRNSLPESSNKELIMHFTIGLRKLREASLRGHTNYLLENIATHPEHRGQGLASQLIEWVIPQANHQNALVYLDTASDNTAMRLYKKLGFQEKGRNTIEDLSKYGGEGSETHVALIRYPDHGT